MSEFALYFELGREHILNIKAYDHLLFLVVLCAVYVLSDWKKVLILVTAFTIGHSISLALAVFDIVRIDSGIIEFLIPLTIALTALANIFIEKQKQFSIKNKVNYFIALFFGVIHGLGFSYYLKSILSKSDSVMTPLLSFNLGIELGQMIIVVVFLLLSYLFISIFGLNRKIWNLGISSITLCVALILLFENKFW